MRQVSHETEQCLRLVQAAAPSEDSAMRATDGLDFVPTPDEQAFAEKWLQEHGLADAIVALHPGAGAPVKQWPSERFGMLAKQLAADHRVGIVVTGDTNEAALVQQVVASSEEAHAAPLVGATIGQVAAVLHRCALAVGGDSGILHLAAAVGTPTVRLYGSVDSQRFGPWGAPEQHQILRSELACVPCKPARLSCRRAALPSLPSQYHHGRGAPISGSDAVARSGRFVAMRIGIDASRALVSQRTGTENYSLHLIRHLLAQAEEELSEDTFDLYCPQRPPAGLFSDSPLARERVIPLPRLWTHVRLSLEMLTNRPDVLFVPAHIIPLFHPASCVVTIHDLGHLYYPETYPKDTLRYLTWGTEHNLKVAQHVLADSQVTKQDIEERFHVEPERITVVYPGISGEYRTGHTPNAIAGVRERYGIDGPYVLYVGTLHPRKNVERLLEAFVAAKREHGLAETLVIAGRLGWLPEGILRRLKDAEPSVKLAGYVPDNDLPLLYEGARLFVPSIPL